MTGGVDGLGLPQQPEEETTRVSNNKPGTAIPCLSQLPPPAPSTSPIVRDRTAHLPASGTAWVGHNLEGAGIENTKIENKLTGFTISLEEGTFHLNGTIHPHALRSCLWLEKEEPSMTMMQAHNRR